MWVCTNIVFNLSAESRQGPDVLRSVFSDQSPPAHLPQALRTLFAIRHSQLAGGASVVGEQSEK